MSAAAVDTMNEQVWSAKAGVAALTLTEHMRQQPLLSLGVAAFAGLVIGGAASSRTGAALLMIIARTSLRHIATEAFARGMTGYGTAERNGSG